MALSFGNVITYGVAEAVPVPLEMLISEMGVGASLLFAFWWLVKDFRKQDAQQAKEIAALYERTSQAERKAWNVQAYSLMSKIDGISASISDVESNIIDIKHSVNVMSAKTKN